MRVDPNVMKRVLVMLTSPILSASKVDRSEALALAREYNLTVEDLLLFVFDRNGYKEERKEYAPKLLPDEIYVVVYQPGDDFDSYPEDEITVHFDLNEAKEAGSKWIEGREGQDATIHSWNFKRRDTTPWLWCNGEWEIPK